MTSSTAANPAKTASIDDLRSDLEFQIKTLEDLDWDYFLETAVRAKIQADLEGRNKPETPDVARSIDEIISDAEELVNR